MIEKVNCQTKRSMVFFSVAILHSQDSRESRQCPGFLSQLHSAVAAKTPLCSQRLALVVLTDRVWSALHARKSDFDFWYIVVIHKLAYLKKHPLHLSCEKYHGHGSPGNKHGVNNPPAARAEDKGEQGLHISSCLQSAFEWLCSPEISAKVSQIVLAGFEEDVEPLLSLPVVRHVFDQQEHESRHKFHRKHELAQYFTKRVLKENAPEDFASGENAPEDFASGENAPEDFASGERDRCKELAKSNANLNLVREHVSSAGNAVAPQVCVVQELSHEPHADGVLHRQQCNAATGRTRTTVSSASAAGEPSAGENGAKKGHAGICVSSELSGFLSELPNQAVKTAGDKEDREKQPVENWAWLHETVYKNQEETRYLELLDDVIRNGTKRQNRTGVDDLTVFGRTLRFSLNGGRLPLLTTKRVFWRGVVEELLWFISGSTDSKQLSAKGVHIWDANGKVDFLRSRGLHDRAEGDLGPVYGFQWRHWGAEYSSCDANYESAGVDQIKRCIETIRSDPSSRRILVSAWNVGDLDKMALPPCHVCFQFWVNQAKNELSCLMYQRSCDLGLGAPFNIASYALLTHMIAHVCGLEAGEFVYMIGDAHVYQSHVEPLRRQLANTPRPFPRVEFAQKVSDIDLFTSEGILLFDYYPHSTVRMELAV